MTYKCPECGATFSRKYHLQRHFTAKHSGVKHVSSCFLCGRAFDDFSLLSAHYKNSHKPSQYFYIKESAFRQKAVIYRYVYDNNTISTALEAQSEFIKNEIKKTVYHEALRKNMIKTSFIFICQFVRYDEQNTIIAKATIPFRSKTFSFISKDVYSIKKYIKLSLSEHLNNIEEFINNGSGWLFDHPIAMDIEIAEVKPILGGCSNFNKNMLRNKTQLINVPATKNRCFIYCVIERLFGKNLTSKTGSEYKKYLKYFDLSNIKFPISIKDIYKFVRDNKKHNLKINILMLSENNVYPLKYGIGDGKIITNLLLVHTPKKGKGVSHYLLIKNLDRYLLNTYRGANNKLCYEQSYFCPNCLNKFSTKKKREKHIELCGNHNSRIERAPEPGADQIYFKKYENQFPQDLIGYLDFECELPKTSNQCELCHTLRCKCDTSYTRFETEQKPICFSFIILNKDCDIMYNKTFSGKNAGDIFINDLLLQEKIWIGNYLKTVIEMKALSYEEQVLYNIADCCYICNKFFTLEDPKVRDHDHSDGLYIGPAHRSCNLKRNKQKQVKIFMHNGAKYDFHFIVKALAKKNVKNLYILPFNMENFRMIKFNSFILLDSIAFLQSSLAQLTQDLKNSGHDYPILKKCDIVKTSGYFDNDKYLMLLEKGFFPYEYW